MESDRNFNSGRGNGGGRRGRGRGGGGGRGNYQDQGGRGRGNDQNQFANQRPPQQQWVNRPPAQSNQAVPPRYGPPQNSAPEQPRPQAWGNRPPQNSASQGVGGRSGQWTGRPWGPSPQSPAPQQPPQVGVGSPGGRSGPWNGRPRGPSPSTPPPVQTPQSPSPPSAGISMIPLYDKLDKPLSSPASSSGSKESQIQPIKRPDRGGTVSIRSIGLLVNHFPVKFDKQGIIFHYDVDVKFVPSNGGAPLKKPLRKSELRFIKDQLFPGDELLRTAYDGEKNIFSAIKLPEGKFTANVPEGEDVRRGSYSVAIKLVNELKLSKLHDYLRGNLSSIPRNTLQGMDLVMKENPLRTRIIVGNGRGFYGWDGEELGGGLAAYKSLNQSLKPTLQGLALCLDYSILSMRKPLPVLDFLKEHIPRFRGANDVKQFRKDVERALRGLKVKVTHRRTNQKYTIAGLAPKDARESFFELIDPEGVDPPRRTGLLQYFREKWGKDIDYPNIPCLDLGRNQKSNLVPMEFCVLVEGQIYPKDDLDKDTALFLKKLTLAKPWERQGAINRMVRADDGPNGVIARNFGISLDVNMTKVTGRVIGAPELKVGASRRVRVDADKCQWNLMGNSFVDAKSLDRWALIDFTDDARDRYSRLQGPAFIENLRERSWKLGIKMAEPLTVRVTRMVEFSSVDRLERLFRNVVEESGRKNKEKLQLIVCAMSRKDPGYKNLKWVSETKIGVVTQCFLAVSANNNRGRDQYLANLCLKINAKLGGNNFELSGKLSQFHVGDHVMFIGADVNHPAAMNKLSPSIAAVVGTVNWPQANRYAARVTPQEHRCEKINNFGEMCLDLLKAYVEHNKVKPTKIIVFRDGVSEGQFDMVLAQELLDLKNTIYTDDYRPPITLIVAQKRHQTRLFVGNRNDGGQSGNVPPGTVVDTEIVHPHDFDFYLCSHYGGLGTSKPTHYYVLWDENSFTSDELQKLIYDMCFTFVRCTKPVSLVPPVYYADLVAYRGRMFQEAVMDNAPDSNASFDQRFYSLHSELENIMFFV
ncbi:hypothetical protein ACS0TY_019287 [Phlomoides rotata]